MAWLVGCEDVVEGAVFSDDDDHMLDGCSGGMLVAILSCNGQRRSEIGDERHQAGSYG